MTAGRKRGWHTRPAGVQTPRSKCRYLSTFPSAIPSAGARRAALFSLFFPTLHPFFFPCPAFPPHPARFFLVFFDLKRAEIEWNVGGRFELLAGIRENLLRAGRIWSTVENARFRA